MAPGRLGQGVPLRRFPGESITDGEKLERIRELAIPPAWQDVWISPNPGAKLQAVGIDRAGRRQYLYSAAYRAAQEQEKYQRLVRFGDRLPALRDQLAEHIDLDPGERDRSVRSLSV